MKSLIVVFVWLSWRQNNKMAAVHGAATFEPAKINPGIFKRWQRINYNQYHVHHIYVYTVLFANYFLIIERAVSSSIFLTEVSLIILTQKY
jgi:hypothetical protein